MEEILRQKTDDTINKELFYNSVYYGKKYTKIEQLTTTTIVF